MTTFRPSGHGPELPRTAAGAAGPVGPGAWRRRRRGGRGFRSADPAFAHHGSLPAGPGDGGPPLRGAPAVLPDAAAQSGRAGGLRDQQAAARAGGGRGAGADAGGAHLPCPPPAAPVRHRRRLCPTPDPEAPGAAGPARPDPGAAAAGPELHHLLRGDRAGEDPLRAPAGAPAGHGPGPGLLGHQGGQPGAVRPLRRAPPPAPGWPTASTTWRRRWPTCGSATPGWGAV